MTAITSIVSADHSITPDTIRAPMEVKWAIFNQVQELLKLHPDKFVVRATALRDPTGFVGVTILEREGLQYMLDVSEKGVSEIDIYISHHRRNGPFYRLVVTYGEEAVAGMNKMSELLDNPVLGYGIGVIIERDYRGEKGGVYYLDDNLSGVNMRGELALKVIEEGQLIEPVIPEHVNLALAQRAAASVKPRIGVSSLIPENLTV